MTLPRSIKTAAKANPAAGDTAVQRIPKRELEKKSQSQLTVAKDK